MILKILVDIYYKNFNYGQKIDFNQIFDEKFRFSTNLSIFLSNFRWNAVFLWLEFQG